jgi:hypothetical protein
MEEIKKEVVGYATTNEVTCVQNSDGTWTATQLVVQSRTFDGTNWEKKEVSCKAIDGEMHKAIADIFMSMATYLESVNGDLFTAEKKESNKELLQ